MSAFGWITTGHRIFLASLLRRRKPRKRAPGLSRASAPGLESLETIDLMSRAGLTQHLMPPAQVQTLNPSSVQIDSTMAETTQTTAVQTATVPTTLTNFSVPFAPPINLFNPALGQLLAVHVTTSATLTSNIQSQNTSTTSPADITGFTNGSFQITGLGNAITGSLNAFTNTVTVPPYNGTDPPFTGASTVTFPPLTKTSAQNLDLTQPSDLAFFTESAGRTTISPVLSANAQAGANAPNGNLQTNVATSGSGVITVTYDYLPTCPTVVRLVRFGIHHQPTTLQVTFSGPIVPASNATNTAYYKVIVPNAHGSFTGPGVTTVPISSATYDQANNVVTLTTARRLNVHHLFQLVVSLPCNDGNSIVIEFGSKKSLGGFLNPHDKNKFVPVVNGHIVRTHG